LARIERKRITQSKPRSRRVDAALLLSALASGALYAFANVGYGFWYLSFVCFVPVLVQLEKHAIRLFDIAKAGFALGGMIYLVGYPWLLALAEGFVASTYSIPLWLVYGAFFALNFALLLVCAFTLCRLGVSLLLAFPCAVVVLETFQLNLFPFYLGASLIHAPILAQAADLGGVYFLSFVLALVNACGASFVTALVSKAATDGSSGMSRRDFVPVLLGLISCAGLYFYGQHALEHEAKVFADQTPHTQLRVGMVQSQLQQVSASGQRFRNHQYFLDLSRELVEKSQLDLLIWPEAAYGAGVRGQLPLDGRLIRKDLDVPMLFGASRMRPFEGQSRTENSVLLMDQQGLIQSEYSKQVLIPFSEYLPLGAALRHVESSEQSNLFGELAGWLRGSVDAVFPQSQNFLAGASEKGLTLNGRNIATPICYEAVMPDLVRAMVNAGDAQLLVSVANDSWFGRSQEPAIHLAMARLRAIEHRRWFVRVTNGGISASIAPDGRITNSIALGVEGSSNSLVQWRDEPTFYASYGPWVLAMLLTVVVLRVLYLRLVVRSPRWKVPKRQAV